VFTYVCAPTRLRFFDQRVESVAGERRVGETGSTLSRSTTLASSCHRSCCQQVERVRNCASRACRTSGRAGSRRNRPGERPTTRLVCDSGSATQAYRSLPVVNQIQSVSQVPHQSRQSSHKTKTLGLASITAVDLPRYVEPEHSSVFRFSLLNSLLSLSLSLSLLLSNSPAASPVCSRICARSSSALYGCVCVCVLCCCFGCVCCCWSHC
jgi:hypothetical protein